MKDDAALSCAPRLNFERRFMKKKKVTVSPLVCTRLGDFISFRYRSQRMHVDIIRKSELFDDSLPVVTLESGGVKYKGLKNRTDTGFIIECKPDLDADTSEQAKEVERFNFHAMHNPDMLGMGRYVVTVKDGEVTYAEYIAETESKGV
jgi:hypothetical protein